MKMKKVFDQIFPKGAIDDDHVDEALRCLNHISRKPTEEDSDLVNCDVGEMSYFTIYDKKFRIVVYIED